MIVTDIVSYDKRRSKIFIDGEFAFLLYKGELSRYGIKEDRELSESVYAEIVTVVLAKRAKLRAMKLLTARAYTEEKLRCKLKEGMYPEEVIEGAICYVKSFGYIDDERYTAEYIYYHAENCNRQQMELKLMQRGISRDLFARQYELFLQNGGENNEIEQIKKVLLKKRFVSEEATIEEKQKLKAMLYRKGFSIDNILAAMDSFT